MGGQCGRKNNEGRLIKETKQIGSAVDMHKMHGDMYARHRAEKKEHTSRKWDGLWEIKQIYICRRGSVRMACGQLVVIKG